MDYLSLLKSRIQASVDLKTQLLSDEKILNTLIALTEDIVACYQGGRKVLWCGNGGSAADAQHLAAELTGRFYYDRPPLSSEALHVNTSYMTAVANDYSYDEVYARLLLGIGRPGDVLIGLSTSGNSPNVVNAMKRAKDLNIRTAGFTGATGGKMKDLSDFLINIPSTDTPRIQECHMLLGHTLCEMVEATLFPKA